jgi:homogentisate 1,2-dioxygenase
VRFAGPNLEPSEAVGWNGYLYPWTFSVYDFEPITGRILQPPLTSDVPGTQLRDLLFCSRKVDFDPLAVRIPYYHSNLQ